MLLMRVSEYKWRESINTCPLLSDRSSTKLHFMNKVEDCGRYGIAPV